MTVLAVSADIRWGFTLPGRDQILEGEEAKPYTAALKRFSDTIAACTTSSNAPAGEMTKGPSKGKEEGAQQASSTIGKRLLDELDLDVSLPLVDAIQLLGQGNRVVSCCCSAPASLMAELFTVPLQDLQTGLHPC